MYCCSFSTCPSLTGSFASRIVMAHPSVSRFTPSKACGLWCFALHLPTRFTVHSVKGLRPLVLCTSPAHPFHGSLRQRLAAFGALHFTCPPVSRFTPSKACGLWCFALHLPTRFTVHSVKGLRPLVLCTSPAHPFHGSLRQTRFTVHSVKGLRPLVLCTSLRSPYRFAQSCFFYCHKYFIFKSTLTYLNKISFLTTLWFEMTKADKEKREMKGVRPRRTPFISLP